MSVIAVLKTKDKIEIASDSMYVSGATKFKDKTGKLNEINNMILGTVGTAEFGTMFRIFAQTHQPREATEFGMMDYIVDYYDWAYKKTNARVIDNELIIVYKDKAFRLENLYVQEIDRFSAIGYGGDFALAALALNHTVSEAVQVACELCIWCEEPIKTTVKFIGGN